MGSWPKLGMRCCKPHGMHGASAFTHLVGTAVALMTIMPVGQAVLTSINQLFATFIILL